MQLIWNDLLDDQDKAVIEKAGYAKLGAASWDSRALGDRPAILVIDMQEMLIGRDVPILDAIDEFRTAMGEIAWRAIDHIVPFIATCRTSGLRVIYTRVIPHDKSATAAEIQIINQLTPMSEDIVIDKRGSSAFYDTELLGLLEQDQIDTLILTGNSTSGCIRATAIDAKQHGIGVMVPIDCVFDRIAASHKISLLDLWMKYARVVSLEEATQYVETVSDQIRVHSES